MSCKRVWLGLSLLSWLQMTWAGTTTYIYTDHLGSPLAEADASGNISAIFDYAPYGGQALSPPRNGPGFTGHVSDAETSLIYMQARYYDPSIGRFLSIDPSPPAGDAWRKHNRYWYAEGNPYVNVDPDGRDVQFAMANGTNGFDALNTMMYLARSPTAMKEFAQMVNSKELYTVLFDKTAMPEYQWQNRTVVVNTRSGLIIRSTGKVQTPALGGGHEMSHGAEHDRVGTEKFVKSLETPGETKIGKDGTVTFLMGISDEEARATKTETQMAKELGEPTRKNYNDTSGEVTTCSPTTTNQC